MDGFWFLWSAWLTVLYISFFSDSKRSSFLYVSLALSVIICSGIVVPAPGAAVGCSAVILLFTGYLLLTHQAKTDVFRTLFLSLCTALLYGWLEFVYFYEPVWMLFSHKTTSVVLMSTLLILTGKSLRLRASALFTGFFQGQVGFWFYTILTVRPGGGIYTVGGMDRLDILGLCFLSAAGFSAFEWAAARIRERVLSQAGLPSVAGKKVNA
ncbi:YphA family membrane protein [Alteribacter keqinensis]|uniref:Uncharacterized protein n=1 Tax=Alteribacter keqinensis TaxID=2483800 RepID=A0A3M7TUB2_9BACI|nr:hypothetical protein [Alteribacter keqinensis]RNA69127.1 hypothetical protein EBO34_04015 [Alteribacter keqinensis]